MRFLRTVLLFAICLTGSCSTTGARSVGGLDLILVDRARDPAAATILFEGRGYMQTGDGWHAELSELARTLDGTGKPAIRFVLVRSDAERLAKWTEANIGKHLAVCVESEVLTIAMIDERLSGVGTITLRGNDPVRVNRWMSAIASN